MSLFTLPERLIAYALVLALIGSGFALFVSHERKLGATAATAALQAGYAKGVAAAAAKAASQAADKQTAVETSHAQDLARKDTEIASGLAARTELDRLRDRLRRAGPAAASAPASTGPRLDGGPDFAGVLDACSVRYEDVAGQAEHLANQVIGLQGYIRGLFVDEPNQIGGSTPVGGEAPVAGVSAPALQPPTGALLRSEGVEAPHP